MPAEKLHQKAVTMALGWYLKHGSALRRMVPVDLENNQALPLAHQNIPTDEDGLLTEEANIVTQHSSTRIHLN